jgi:hypothetical protein
MKAVYMIGLLILLGAIPALSQAKGPVAKPGFPFRYYKPGLYDSLRFLPLPQHPGSWPGRIHQEFKFNSPDLRFHGALPSPGGMPAFRPVIRDRMPVMKPDTLVHYQLRVKPIPQGRIYK